jgi:hypothetical protein
MEAKMKRLVAVLPVVLLLGIVLFGCEPPAAPIAANSRPPAPPGPPGSEPPAAPVAAAPAAPAPQPAARPNERPIPLESKAGIFAGGLDELSAPVSRPASSQPASPAADPNVERVKAEKGVGIKGRSLDEYEGVIVTPAKTLFTVREDLIFKSITHALNLFNASEGRNPESHEEFMEKIVEFNNIKLPELPPGQKYVYDPEKNELMVERPKLKSAP